MIRHMKDCDDGWRTVGSTAPRGSPGSRSSEIHIIAGTGTAQGGSSKPNEETAAEKRHRGKTGFSATGADWLHVSRDRVILPLVPSARSLRTQPQQSCRDDRDDERLGRSWCGEDGEGGGGASDGFQEVNSEEEEIAGGCCRTESADSRVGGWGVDSRGEGGGEWLYADREPVNDLLLAGALDRCAATVVGVRVVDGEDRIACVKLRYPELQLSTPAHTKHLGWHVDVGSGGIWDVGFGGHTGAKEAGSELAVVYCPRGSSGRSKGCSLASRSIDEQCVLGQGNNDNNIYNI